MEDNTQVKYKTSRFLLLLNLIIVIAVIGIAYLTLYGKTNFVTQTTVNAVQNEQIHILERKNNLLSLEINKLKNEQKKLAISINQLNPSKTGILLSQVNSLISSANQSIILYHNINSAIKLLNTAQQTLTISNDLIFDALKIALTHDINNLSGQNQYDNTVLQTQLEDLTTYIYAVADTKPKSENQMIKQNNGDRWENFKNNVTGTLQGLFPNSQQKFNSENVKNTYVLVQLSLNLKQSMLTYNQDLWDKNLAAMKDEISTNDINNIDAQKVLELIKLLEKVNFNNKNNSLDATINALSKTNQLYGN